MGKRTFQVEEAAGAKAPRRECARPFENHQDSEAGAAEEGMSESRWVGRTLISTLSAVRSPWGL